MEGNGYETWQSSLLHVFVQAFGLAWAQNKTYSSYWGANQQKHFGHIIPALYMTAKQKII